MDYKQFMKLMETGELAKPGNIDVMQEFVKEFPFFQTAQILLAASMNELQHVRFEKQLKTASAYAGDRKVLYELIHTKPVKLFSDEPIMADSPFISETNKEEPENIFTEKESVNIPPVDTDDAPDLTPSIPIETIAVPVSYKAALETQEEEEEEEIRMPEKISGDPHDIIRQRLNEILGLKEGIKEEIPEEEKTQASIIEIKEEEKFNVIPQEERNVINEIADESVNAVDVVDKSELEYALESTIIQSLEKLPVIEKTVEEITEVPPVEKNDFTFIGWLKNKQVSGFGKIEMVHADEEDSGDKKVEVETIKSKKEPIKAVEKRPEEISRLIDNFIKTEPKIIPSKAEFYSPAVQAKKSITENEDLVSETLAMIYFQQGHLFKARASYEKLSLLYPEKLAYFAARISEVEKAIKNQDKQDF